MSDSSDPRISIVKSFNLAKSRIIRKPHVVFVCGGPSVVSDKSNQSIRHIFLKKVSDELSKNSSIPVKTETAEDYREWPDKYNSLATFQSDIAALSSIILVIPESGGSLVELGYLYRDDETRKKLIILTNEKYYNEDSFTKHGVFLPHQVANEASVLSYKFRFSPPEISTDTLDEIIVNFFEECETTPDESEFETDSKSGTAFVIFQLIDLFSVLKLRGIMSYLKMLGISINQTRLKQLLFTLQIFGYLTEIRMGANVFYLSKQDAESRIHFANNSRNGIQYTSEKLRVIAHYNTTGFRKSHDNRYKILGD